MSRVPLVSFASAMVLSLSAGAALANGASTTRIEPRPFYGAVVTIESGVRVFRPLPRHKNIIINPGNRTPLNLSIEDVTETRTVNETSTHNHYDRSVQSSDNSAGVPAYLGGKRLRKGHGKRRHGVRRHRRSRR